MIENHYVYLKIVLLISQQEDMLFYSTYVTLNILLTATAKHNLKSDFLESGLITHELCELRQIVKPL